jgi:type IV fimbrial biogenesis protein FimT
MRNSANAAVLGRGKKRNEQQDLHMRKRKGSRGVTLVELLFGLAIAAILTGLVLPSMRSALRAASVRTATFELLAGLQQTRASSIAAARPGVLCLADGAGNCLGNAGTAGAWRAFLEAEGGQLPLAARELPSGVLLKASRSRLAFWPDSLSASTATLTICDTQGIARPRAIVMSQGGRLRLGESPDGTCGA